jgi:hypothetical protein
MQHPSPAASPRAGPGRRSNRLARWAGCVLALIVPAAPAAAEIVYLAPTGRAMTVRSHRIEGSSIVLVLRGGGEIVCDRSLVLRIQPDEVPFPEPEATGVPSIGGVSSAPPYAELVDAIAAAEGVDARLVHAVIQVESAYQPRAVSRRGAMGLMQLMPITARQYAVADPYDPRANVEAGVRHLKALLSRFDLSLALAAYNAGEVAIRKFGGIPPYRETREYVARVLKLAGLASGN